MLWITSLRSGFATLLAEPRQACAASTQQALEQLRQAILATMEDAGLQGQQAELLNKVRYAGSVRTLWYARTDLMMALAASRGEAYAQQQLEQLSRRFLGLLPEARHYRAGRLPR